MILRRVIVAVLIGLLAAMWGMGPWTAGPGAAQDATGPANLSGFWRVVRDLPGSGIFAGRVTLRRQGAGRYRVNYQLIGEDGAAWRATGSAVLQGGNAWRSTLTRDGPTVIEAATLSEDGNFLSGRWHQAGSPTLIGSFRAVRMAEGISALMAVTPKALKPGQVAVVVLYGTGLDGPADFGPGVAVVDSRLASPVRMEIAVRVDAGAAPGARTVTVGATRAAGIFTITE